MSVKIRLKRMGMKKKPFYRVVVADIRSPRDGRFIEEIGYYDPMTKPAEIKVDNERAKYWLGVGAQPTDTARALLKKIGEARFTCVELNLYLDTHPDDVAARADFNSYSDKLQALLDTYTNAYGPLMNFGQCALDAVLGDHIIQTSFSAVA